MLSRATVPEMLRALATHMQRRAAETSRCVVVSFGRNLRSTQSDVGRYREGPFSSASFATGIPTGESIEVIRARVFENHIGNNLRSGRKVLRKKPIGDVLMNWYYPVPEKEDPLFIDLDAERYRKSWPLPVSLNV